MMRTLLNFFHCLFVLYKVRQEQEQLAVLRKIKIFKNTKILIDNIKRRKKLKVYERV